MTCDGSVSIDTAAGVRNVSSTDTATLPGRVYFRLDVEVAVDFDDEYEGNGTSLSLIIEDELDTV